MRTLSLCAYLYSYFITLNTSFKALPTSCTTYTLPSNHNKPPLPSLAIAALLGHHLTTLATYLCQPMTTSASLFDESTRLTTLRASGLLGSGSEERFDRIVRLAAHLFGASYAMISLVDEKSIEAKSSVGLLATPHARAGSFCDIVVSTGQSFSISDALAHPVHAQSPWATEYPQARFYVGVPVRAPNGAVLGALALLDPEPWEMEPGEISMLNDLAEMAETEIALSFALNAQQETLALLADARSKPSLDPLTNLWNRSAIDQIIKAELSRSLRGEPTTLACIGIDALASINQSHGRAAGDGAIAAIASCIRHCIRDFDFVARDQDDRFLLVLSNCDKKAARAVCERIRTFIAKQNFTSLSGQARTTVSIGLATSSSGPLSREAVIAAAERCMLVAKSAGRNRIHSDSALH
jgi:diguanylate cyclase (GGDEF)-like protein